MNYTNALKVASARAKKRGQYAYVVKNGDSELDYEVTNNEFDLDTIFAGARVIATFGPDGEREYGYDY